MTSETASVLSPAPLVASAPAKTAKSLRRSLEIITLAWVFGAIWSNATTGTPLTLFAQGLGASKFQFGLLAALPFIASLVSLPASLLIERTGRRKPFFLHGLYLQRVLWVPIALAPVWVVCRWGAGASGQAMTLLLWLTFLMNAAGSFSSPAWASWMADVVPDRVRGTYFSRRRQWGILTGVPAALLVGWLLDHCGGGAAAGAAAGGTPVGTAALPGFLQSLATLRWCAIIFLGAAVCGVADISCFQTVPDPRHPPQTGAALLRGLATPLHDRPFLAFSGLIATLTFAVSFMNQFVTLYVIEKARVDNTGSQLMLLVAPMLAQLCVLPAWGKAVDRMGKKPVLTAAAAGLVPVGLGWCLTTEANPWLGYALSAAGAALWTGVEVANFNLVLEGSGAKAGGGARGGGNAGGASAYAAVNGVIVNVAGCIGGLAAGFLAEALRDWVWQPTAGGKRYSFYDVLFALSGVMRLAALLVFVPLLREPAARGTAEAVRFMVTVLIGNAREVVARPLRQLRPRRGRLTVEGPEGVDAPAPQPAPGVLAWGLPRSDRETGQEQARGIAA